MAAAKSRVAWIGDREEPGEREWVPTGVQIGRRRVRTVAVNFRRGERETCRGNEVESQGGESGGAGREARGIGLAKSGKSGDRVDKEPAKSTKWGRGVENEGGGNLTRLRNLTGAASEAESEGKKRNKDAVRGQGTRDELRDD